MLELCTLVLCTAVTECSEAGADGAKAGYSPRAVQGLPGRHLNCLTGRLGKPTSTRSRTSTVSSLKSCKGHGWVPRARWQDQRDRSHGQGVSWR